LDVLRRQQAQRLVRLKQRVKEPGNETMRSKMRKAVCRKAASPFPQTAYFENFFLNSMG
jgi:hypothetical protein